MGLEALWIGLKAASMLELGHRNGLELPLYMYVCIYIYIYIFFFRQTYLYKDASVASVFDTFTRPFNLEPEGQTFRSTEQQNRDVEVES